MMPSTRDFLVQELLADVLPKVKANLGEAAWATGTYEAAAKLFDRIQPAIS